MIAALTDSRPSVRSLASEALGEIGSKEAVPALVALLRTDSSGARLEAVDALGKIGDPAALESILAVMKTGSAAVKKRAIPALSRFPDSRSVDALVASLTDQNEEVRQLAATGLGELGSTKVAAQLERIGDTDVSADVRAAAARAVERLRSREQLQTGKTGQKTTPP